MVKDLENLDNILTNIGYGKYQFAVFITATYFNFSVGAKNIPVILFQEYLTSHLDYDILLATILIIIVNVGGVLGNFSAYLLC